MVLTAATWSAMADANGRMPGATELTVPSGRGGSIVTRATFGLVQSFDDGASWQWVCESAIRVSGEFDPPMAVTGDGTLVLLPATGGALSSRDRGCTWEPASAPLEGVRAIDLTNDPNDRARVLVASSAVDTIDPEGRVSYANRLIETTDNARTWLEISDLPSDFVVETLEVAASDSQRIYVTGTASDDALLGIVERSDDGGESWTRSELPLPQGSGSLYLSGIHPSDPDRIWVRVPARGDSFGLFPASLLTSSDGGQNWEFLADTQRAMFGFALSPDGSRLAYGGPADGLFVGPSDGSGEFEKVSELGVRCLEWTESALYACASEPSAPFSLGRSTDEGATFEPLFRMAETCPRECDDAESFWATCEPAWEALSPILGIPGGACQAASEPPDAGTAGRTDAAVRLPDAGGGLRSDAASRDASSLPVLADGSTVGPRKSSDAGGCSCRVPYTRRAGRGARGSSLLLAVAAIRRRRRRPRGDSDTRPGT